MEILESLPPHAIEVLGVVFVSMVLGGVIGLEREIANRPAGLRTHMLVAGSCALIVSISDLLMLDVASEVNGGFIRADPIRIIEAVVTGVSFICAGTIIRRDDLGVEGLTTAASLLFSASIAICIAMHQYFIGVFSVVLAICVLKGIKLIEVKLHKQK